MDIDIGYSSDVVLTDTVGVVILPRRNVVFLGQKPDITARVNLEHPLSEGLVGLWLFNEGHGGVVRDLSIYGYHGTFGPYMNVDTGWVIGPNGYSVDFDGYNDYITLGELPQLDGVSGMTVCCIFRTPEEFKVSNVGLVAKYVGYGEAARSWGLFINTQEYGVNAPKLNVAVSPDGKFWPEYSVVGKTTLDANQWYMGAFSFASDDVINVYLDGNIDAVSYNVPTHIFSSSKPTLIGLQYFDPGDASWRDALFGGEISGVIIYDRALSADEIAELYENPYAMLEYPTNKRVLFGLSSISYDIGYYSDIIIAVDVSYFSDVILLSHDNDAYYISDIFVTHFMLRPDVPIGVGIKSPSPPVGGEILSPDIPTGVEIKSPETPKGISISAPDTPSGISVMAPSTPKGLHMVSAQSVPLLRSYSYGADIILINNDVSCSYIADVLIIVT